METAEEKVDVREDASLDLETEEKVDEANALVTEEKVAVLVSDLTVAVDLETEKKVEAVSAIVEAALETAKKVDVTLLLVPSAHAMPT
jgi:hypothetical protein